MTNWANRGKAAVAAVPVTKQASGNNLGTRHIGIVESFEQTTFGTGSRGIKASYTIPGEKYPVNEYIVQKLFKEGKLEPTKYGNSTRAKRLAALGLTSDQINKLADDSLGDHVFNGAKVAVYLVDEEYMGKPKKRVKAVFPLDDNE